MNLNSPIVTRLRSNKNYQPLNAFPKKKTYKLDGGNESLSSEQFQSIVDQICSSVPNDNETESEFLSKIEIDDDNFTEKIIQQTLFKDELVEKMNDLNLIKDLDPDESWFVSFSKRNGYKLYSLGFCYNAEKPKQEFIPEATKIYWRCENYPECGGRANSNGLVPPLKITRSHNVNHQPKPELKDQLKALNEIKAIASKTSDPPRSVIQNFYSNLSDDCIVALPKRDAIRQLINRTRNFKAGQGYNAKSLEELIIPENLTKTLKGKKFLFGDSGQNDKNRIIFFTTEENLKLLSTNNDWYVDGTFDISPTIFKQVYTIHIIFKGTTLPMLFALLPNKKKTTYKKLFRMISKLIFKKPNSINCDFELAAISSMKSEFGCKIYVIEAFNLIKSSAPKNAKSFLSYIENNYIGTMRSKARFPIEFWNLNERVKLDLPRTNNNIESWHSRLSKNVSRNLTIKKIIELFQIEQNSMESDLVVLFSGKQLKLVKHQVLRRENELKTLLFDYQKCNLELFLDGMARLISDKIYNSKSERKLKD